MNCDNEESEIITYGNLIYSRYLSRNISVITKLNNIITCIPFMNLIFNFVIANKEIYKALHGGL
jgi:hypothetical protein